MATKRKNCNPKKSYNCGNSCITARYVCRKDGLQGQSVDITNRLTDAITSVSKESKPTLSPIREYENSIRKNSFESAALTDTTGKVLATVEGDSGSVFVGDLYSDSSWKERESFIVTHNHPTQRGVDGGTFSAADLDLFITNNFQELRAVSVKYDHTIRRPAGQKSVLKEGSLSARNHSKLGSKIAAEYISEIEKYKADQTELHRDFNEVSWENQWTTEQRNEKWISFFVGWMQEKQHETVTRLAEKYGFEYIREEV